MTIGTTDRDQVLAAVQSAVEKNGASPDELIPILNEVNRTIGYLPPEALDEISRLMRVPKSQLFSVASFYQMLSTKPRGRHVVKFCESAPCHVVGGRQVWQALQKKMGLKAGETSIDGKWTLVTTSCLGVCGVGPVVLIDDDIYGNVTPDQLDTILARYE
jgi:NADH:ubiquinone oxidoreductase subunit E